MRNIETFTIHKSAKFYLFDDPYNTIRNPELFEAVKNTFPLTNDPCQASAIILIGGDGTFLKVARNHSINHLPLIAINGGTVGKNLIDVKASDIPALYDSLISDKCSLITLPSVKMDFLSDNGTKHTKYAFNDIFVDRLLAHTVRYEAFIYQLDTNTFSPVKLNETSMSGDGILLSTSIGSTGYARVLSETILPMDSYSLLVTPMATMINESKRKVHGFILDENMELAVNFLDTDFRPARISVDGVYLTNSANKTDFIGVTRFKASLNRNNRQLKLVIPNIENLVQKQIAFIAR